MRKYPHISQYKILINFADKTINKMHLFLSFQCLKILVVISINLSKNYRCRNLSRNDRLVTSHRNMFRNNYNHHAQISVVESGHPFGYRLSKRHSSSQLSTS